MIPVLWLGGPPGVGKTAVAWEIYARLERAGSAPAYVDVDQLGMCHPPEASDPERHMLKARNVSALRRNFSAAGARCLVVSGVADASRGPEVGALGGPPITVGRLRSDPAELRARLARRQGSFAQPDAAVVEADLLDHSTFAHWSLDTTELSVSEVANRVLAEAGDWAATGMDRRDRPPPDNGARDRATGEVLWLCGTTGVGKSTVGFRVYLDVLRSGIPAAYVDVDQLGFCSTAPSDHLLRAQNLAALWANFHDAGVRVAVVVGPVASRPDAHLYERALPKATFTWCSLHVRGEELTRRILSRGEGGSWPQPGDPLRDQPRDELLKIADRAILAAQMLAGRPVGLRINLDGLSIDEAAETIRKVAAWPAAKMTENGPN